MFKLRREINSIYDLIRGIQQDISMLESQSRRFTNFVYDKCKEAEGVNEMKGRRNSTLLKFSKEAIADVTVKNAELKKVVEMLKRRGNNTGEDFDFAIDVLKGKIAEGESVINHGKELINMILGDDGE